MSNVSALLQAPKEAVHAAVPLRELWPWMILIAALLMLAYLAGVEGGSHVHEFLHDGRHLLGFPCH